MRPFPYFLGALSLAVSLLLSGCGGDGSSMSPTSSKVGRLAVNLVWPNPRAGRVIPAASNAITLVVTNSTGSAVARGTIVRPGTSWTSGVLSPGTYTLTARAFPNASGPGNVQAQGTGSVVVVEGQDTPATVTMASTVASVAVTTTSSYVNVGSTVQYSASCKDSAGNIVIVAPSALTWNSSNTAHGQVSSTGLLSGIGGGSTTVSATFNEVESTLAQSPIASTPVPIEVIQSSGFVPVGYNLAWSDEFDGTLGSTPNATNWTYDLGAGGWGNNEQETYTSTNATVISDSQATDGLALDIKATKSGSTYYSSRIKTEGLRSFTYGYIECRAKVPPGGANYQGYWPAFWMLGNSITTVGWPTCGEQDIMEHLSGTAPTNAYQSLHGQNSSGGWDTTQTYTSSPDLGAGYHTYAVLWKQNSITFYVDGIQDGPTQTPSNVGSGNAWEFNQPEFLILNLAVGGNWPGNITGATTFPADYLIDYVRVYQ